MPYSPPFTAYKMTFSSIRKRLPDTLVKRARFVRDSIQAARDFRVNVSIFEGVEAESRSPLRVLYAGKSSVPSYLLENVFETDRRTDLIRNVGIWHLQRQLERYRSECDMCLLVIPPLFWMFISHRDYFCIPDWIAGEIPIVTDDKAPRNRSLANDLRRIHKHGLEPDITIDLCDLEDFYHNMHVPLIKASFKSRAYIASYASVQERFGDCELLLIKRDGVAIAGGLFDYSLRCPRFWSIGIRCADT